VVTCLERGVDLHKKIMVQLMPLPLAVSCFSKIQIGSTFLVSAHLGCLRKRAIKWVCVCVCDSYCMTIVMSMTVAHCSIAPLLRMET